jgi:hypothetical protein
MDRQVLLALGTILATPKGEDPNTLWDAGSLTDAQQAELKHYVTALGAILQGAQAERDNFAKSLAETFILPSEPTPEEESEDEPSSPDEVQDQREAVLATHA